MAFNNYYLRFKNGNTIKTFPLSWMMIDTLEIRPKIVMDLDPYYDSTGLLHRNVVEHTSASIKFSTPPLPMFEKEAVMTFLQSIYTDAKARDCTVQYYNDETGTYSDWVSCYMAEPKFRPKEKNGSTGEILYNPIELEFIQY
jgi:hypothetical protein